MDLDAILGIDWSDPTEQNAAQLVESDANLLDALVQLREDLGLSQSEVADRLGVGPSAISRIESGERDPHLSTLRRYALALGARVEHRVSRFEPMCPRDGWALEAAERMLTAASGSDAQRHADEIAGSLAAKAWGAPR